MTRARLFTAVLAIAIVTVFMYATVIVGDDATNEKFIDLYIRIAKLAKEGVNVSHLVEKLAVVNDALQKNELTSINNTLSSLEVEVLLLEERASSIVFMQNLFKILTAVFIASIPVFTYLFLPRAYLYLWYRARRRWYIRYEHSR